VRQAFHRFRILTRLSFQILAAVPPQGIVLAEVAAALGVARVVVQLASPMS
jgi:hypothetical protein